MPAGPVPVEWGKCFNTRLFFLIKKMSLNILFILIVYFFYGDLCNNLLKQSFSRNPRKKKPKRQANLFAGSDNDMGWGNRGQTLSE